MSSFSRRLAEANAALDVQVDADATQRLRGRVAARVARRRRIRAAVYSGALLAVLGLGLGARFWGQRPTAGPELVAAVSRESSLLEQRLGDGSQIERLSADSIVRVVGEQPELVRIALVAGAARFRITPKPTRRFVVSVDNLEVEVVGTTFELVRSSTSLSVRVAEGRVRVRASGTESLLSGGEAGTFALGVGSAEPAASVRPRPLEAELNSRPASSVGAGAPDWRGLARAGKFAQAYAVMPRATSQAAPASVDELLLRADVARLSGHPAEAVAPLRSLLARSSQDSRAPSASFSLAQVYEQLGRHSEAASAFARARALQPNGPLAEDASAREVLALLASGSTAQAKAQALQYLARYPQGVRAQEIRKRTRLP